MAEKEKEEKDAKDAPAEAKKPKPPKGEKKPRESKAVESDVPKAAKPQVSGSQPPRLQVRYAKEVVPQLMKELNETNPMAVPKLTKIVINMGVGKATENEKRLAEAVETLSVLSGQKPVVTRAKVSVAGFRLRQGLPIGCKVTIRRQRMYEFLDRLISLALPRVRDFRGLPLNSFDRFGNYTFGLAEQVIFPEVRADKLEFTQGMDVTLCTNAGTPERAKALLVALGIPFRKVTTAREDRLFEAASAIGKPVAPAKGKEPAKKAAKPGAAK